MNCPLHHVLAAGEATEQSPTVRSYTETDVLQQCPSRSPKAQTHMHMLHLMALLHLCLCSNLLLPFYTCTRSSVHKVVSASAPVDELYRAPECLEVLGVRMAEGGRPPLTWLVGMASQVTLLAALLRTPRGPAVVVARLVAAVLSRPAGEGVGKREGRE